MPGHSYPDRVRIGETLEAGDFLVSADGRFRLYMEQYGFLALYAYVIGVGRVWIWPTYNPGKGPGTFFDIGPGVRLEVRPWTSLAGEYQLAVYTSSGEVRWGASQDMVLSGSEVALVLQNDGNLVLRQGAGVGWATNTYDYLPHYESAVVNPTIPCMAIKHGQIAVDVDPENLPAGYGKFENPLDAPVGIRDALTYVTLPRRGGKVAGRTAATTGTVAVETENYPFPPLSASEDPAGFQGNIQPAPVGTPGPHSGDAIPVDAIAVNPTHPHQAQVDSNGRFHLLLGQGPDGVYMTDAHAHSDVPDGRHQRRGDSQRSPLDSSAEPGAAADQPRD